MSPRYQIVEVDPATLAPGDRIQTRLNVPGASHVTEYIVTKTDPAAQTVHAVDAYDADAPTTHLRYIDWAFARAEA